MTKSLPDWLFLWCAKALVGEIYPELRAVSAGLDEQRNLSLRFILKQDPTELDFEKADEVLTNILANTSCSSEISEIQIDCICSSSPLSCIDPDGGWVFARSEDLDKRDAM
jgi:hypothetical protein